MKSLWIIPVIAVILIVYGINSTYQTPSQNNKTAQTVSPTNIPTPTITITISPTETPIPTQQYNYQYTKNTYPTESYVYESPTDEPTPSGLQGQVNCNYNYANGYDCYDDHGNQATLNYNYAGGYDGQDSYGNQIHLNSNYAGGYAGTNGSQSINCESNYANGYNCN